MALGAGDTVIWHGGTDTDYEEVTNWTPQEIPIDQVHVMVSAAAVNSMLVNLDRTGDSGGNGLDLRSIYIQDNSTIDIGASGNSLICTVDNTAGTKPSITHCGKGSLHFSSEIGGGAARTTGAIVINSPNMDDAAIISGEFVTQIDKLVCVDGHTRIATTCLSSIDWVFVTGGIGKQPVLVIDEVALNHDRLYVVNGVVECSRGFNTVNLYGGVFRQASKAPTAIRQHGGVFYPNSPDTIATAILMGGFCDATSEKKQQSTITDLYKGPFAVLNRNWLLTVTNEYDIFGEDMKD